MFRDQILLLTTSPRGFFICGSLIYITRREVCASFTQFENGLGATIPTINVILEARIYTISLEYN